MIDYNKRLVEVDEVLRHLSNENYKKIPHEIIQIIKENKDKEYSWTFDETKSLKEQNLNRDTIAILSYLNMEYLLNSEQKEFIMKIHQQNEQKLEDEKKNKYSNNIFENKQINKDEKYATVSNNMQLIEYKENFFTKLINKIKSFFKR